MNESGSHDGRYGVVARAGRRLVVTTAGASLSQIAPFGCGAGHLPRSRKLAGWQAGARRLSPIVAARNLRNPSLAS